MKGVGEQREGWLESGRQISFGGGGGRLHGVPTHQPQKKLSIFVRW